MNGYEDSFELTTAATADKTSCGGFTLLEVMVAVAILAIALIAILKANVQSLDALAEVRQKTAASMLAASKLAEVEAVGAENWTEFQGDFGDEYPGFSWQVESAATELEGIVRVIVIVRMTGTVSGEATRIEELLYAQ